MEKALFIIKSEKDLSRLGHFIKKCRKNKNILQKDIADKTGIQATYLSKVEQGGKWNPTIKTLIRHVGLVNCEIIIRAKT